MGDLNFRLEADPSDLSPEDIVKLVSREEFGKLFAKDQLTLARSNGDAFSELNETLPTFPPSYKYKIGSSDYDLKRAPAWTDRILFKANVANYDHYVLSLNQHQYSSHGSLCQSDHKPVTSNFSLAVFSQKIAADLLLSCFNPIVTFLDTGPYYVNEDLTLIYTVKIDDRRWLSNWDWIALYRVGQEIVLANQLDCLIAERLLQPGELRDLHLGLALPRQGRSVRGATQSATLWGGEKIILNGC